MSQLELRQRVLVLLVFPITQAGFFLLSCLLIAEHPGWAVACLLVSSLTLNFTIHICAHELLHYSDRRPLPFWMNVLISIISGVAFDGYRVHHHNHHQHNNGQQDFSRTWRTTPQGPLAYGVWRYAFGWPMQVVRMLRWLDGSRPLSARLTRLRRSMRRQSAAVFAALLTLGLVDRRFAVLYAAMIYFGWVCVSIHNYGQHPPASPTDVASYTRSRWYNLAFFNNGLHHEHHAEPTKSWRALEADPAAPQIPTPHLAEPILSRSPRLVREADTPNDRSTADDKKAVDLEHQRWTAKQTPLVR